MPDNIQARWGRSADNLAYLSAGSDNVDATAQGTKVDAVAAGDAHAGDVEDLGDAAVIGYGVGDARRARAVDLDARQLDGLTDAVLEVKDT